MEILKVQHLCKTYGKGEAKVEALKDVSFTLEQGEFAAVVGESGSGKSTLLVIMTSGVVIIWKNRGQYSDAVISVLSFSPFN